MKTLKDLINQYSKEMKLHISEFGKGKNRDIDTREKSTMIMIPIVIQKRLRAEAVKVVNECCKFIDECGTNPSRKDMYLLNIKWVNFLNLTEKDLDWEKQK